MKKLPGTRVRSPADNPPEQHIDPRPGSTPPLDTTALIDLKIAVEQSANSIVITDTAGTILYVNPAFTKTTGYSANEAIGNNPRILKSDTLPSEFYEELWDTITSGQTWHGTFCNRSKSGDIFWENATITPVINPAGQIERYIAVKANITAQHVAETRLHELLTQLRVTQSFLEQTSHVARVGGWSFDPATKRLEWTRETRAIHEVPDDYSPDIATALDFYQEGDDRQRMRAAIERTLATGQPFDIESRFTTAKNRLIWVRSIGQAEITDGHCTRIYGTFQDISREKLLQQELEKTIAEKQRQVRFVTELTSALPLAVYCKDHNGRFILANPAFCRLHNLSQDDIIGKTSTEIFRHPIYESVLEQDLAMLRGEAKTDAREWTVRSPCGKVVPTIMNKSVFYDEKGRPAGIVGALTDISQIKQLNADLETAKEQAEAANRAKGAFLATMSHEIRTPLNAVIGMASLLEESNIDPQQREYARTIVGASETLLDLISDILDYSKIESRKLELHLEPFVFEDLFLEPLEWFNREAAAKGIELAHYLDPSLPAVCLGDRLRIKQILMNLLSNAIKFTHEGSVQISVCRGIQSGDSTQFCFRVTDTGIGISPEARERLFQPFSQADSSITRQYGGSGLGLAISRQLITLMGGRIDASSQPGRGSEFRFDLFLQPASLPDSPPPQIPSLSDKRVLVIDDVPTNLLLVAAYARQWGMQPIEATSAEEALRILADDSGFDAILLDYHMPKVDGVRLASALAANPALSGIPRILLSSAAASDSDIPAGLFQAIMLKPLRPTKLRQLLADLLSHESPLRDQPSIHASSFQNLHILVAEDNPNNQVVMSMMLKKIGASSIIVDNGRKALDTARSQQFQAIILDLQMPVMDGITAVEELRKLYSDKPHRPLLIALTANAFVEDQETCLRAGFDSYLAKPITITQLRDALSAAL